MEALLNSGRFDEPSFRWASQTGQVSVFLRGGKSACFFGQVATEGASTSRMGSFLAGTITVASLKWDLPGALLDNGEEVRACTAERESWEEAGYKFRADEFLGGAHGNLDVW